MCAMTKADSTCALTWFSLWTGELCSCSIELSIEESRSAVGVQRADGILKTILPGMGSVNLFWKLN